MNDEQPHDYCMKCDRPQPVKPTRLPTGIAWYCTVCGNMTDFDQFDEWDCSGEPVGSCENCGTNLYEDDDEELCDQCIWWAEVRRSDEA